MQALPADKQKAFELAAKQKGWLVDDQPSNDWQALAAEIAAEPPAEPYIKPRRSK